MAIDERNPEAQLKHFINELVQNVTNDIEQKLLDQIWTATKGLLQHPAFQGIIGAYCPRQNFART